MKNSPLSQQDADYADWLHSLKSRVRQVQLKAAVSVNRALLQFYWELGSDIVEKQQNTSWGDGFLTQLSQDLVAAFPDMRGFSKRNLEQVRRWYLFYSESKSIAKQPVSQLEPPLVEQITRIPWGHNIAIVTKCKSLAIH